MSQTYPPPPPPPIFLTGFGQIRKLNLKRTGGGRVLPSPPRGAATAYGNLQILIRQNDKIGRTLKVKQ
jgi:hypothetical protein